MMREEIACGRSETTAVERRIMHIQRLFGVLALSLGLFLALLAGLGGLMPAQADPDTLFVKPGGTGTACTQANPCTLPTALSQAGDGDTMCRPTRCSVTRQQPPATWAGAAASPVGRTGRSSRATGWRATGTMLRAQARALASTSGTAPPRTGTTGCEAITVSTPSTWATAAPALRTM